MMKYLVLLVACLSAFAQIDYEAKVSTRTYPTGLALNADAGYGQKLWGEGKVLYGYVRPALGIQTSALVNYATAQLEFFPISFLGVYAGKSYGNRMVDELQGFDCDVVKCDTSIEKSFYGYNMALAFKGAVLVSRYKKSEFENKTGNDFFAEEFSNLIGYQDDTLETYTHVLGYKFKEHLMFGYLNMYNRMEKLTQRSRMHMLIGNYTSGSWSYLVGAGSFYNRNAHNHFSMIFEIKWTGDKGLRLF